MLADIYGKLILISNRNPAIAGPSTLPILVNAELSPAIYPCCSIAILDIWVLSVGLNISMDKNTIKVTTSISQ